MEKRPIAVSYAAVIGDHFKLKSGKFKPLCAQCVYDFLFEEELIQMEWLSCSLDRNSTQNLAKILADDFLTFYDAYKLSKNWKELVWKNKTEYIPLLINNLFESIPCRCATLSALQGKYTSNNNNFH